MTPIKAEKPIRPQHALVGIVAVSLAAILSSLTSGMLSVGLEDLRGAWHLGIDDAAYVPTAFNAAQMFMGPISIMLAARFGHRRVLVFAGGVFALTMLFLPLLPHIVPILTLLVVAGLAAGTFYPLCLSFITRNLPLSLVTYGIAAYNFDLLGTNHIVQSLESFYIDNLSWQWLFWNQALVAFPFLVCVYFGITHTPQHELLPKFSYRGIMYMACSLTLFYIALDQGERLDWFNNGLINGLFIGGAFLLIAAFVRRSYKPNPHLDFSYLRGRNLLLLAVLLVTFRTMLLRISLIIPTFLQTVHQYRSTELGNFFMLSMGPFLIAMPLCAYLLKKYDLRLMLMIGFAILALCNFYDAHSLVTWIGIDFVPAQMCGAIGICMVAMGTMSGIVFEGRMTGAYRNRAGAYCQGAFFQAVRLFGIASAVSALRRYLLVREHFWQTQLASGSAWFDDLEQRVQHLGTAVMPQAASVGNAASIALGLTVKNLKQQALTLACNDCFMTLAWVCVVSLLAVAMMTKVPLPEKLPAADA